MKRFVIPCFLAAVAVLASPAISAPLYVNNFDTDTTADWTVRGSANVDYLADFFYDYSAIGVPAAPGGSSTRGLKLTANNSAGVFGGVSVSPTGETFTGNYKLTFDLWQNYVGPLGPGGNGTTQLSTYGVGTSGATAVWPGATAANHQQVMFAHTLDAGSTHHFRAYNSTATTSYASGNAVYAAPSKSTRNTDSYYTGVFPSVSAPAEQITLYPGQTGATDAGETSFAWRKVEIDVRNSIATWSIDGTLIATVPVGTLSGSSIFFGHSDTNATASNSPFDTLLNITLIDNVQVVPEPSSIAIAGAAVLGLVALGRRRR